MVKSLACGTSTCLYFIKHPKCNIRGSTVSEHGLLFAICRILLHFHSVYFSCSVLLLNCSHIFYILCYVVIIVIFSTLLYFSCISHSRAGSEKCLLKKKNILMKYVAFHRQNRFLNDNYNTEKLNCQHLVTVHNR